MDHGKQVANSATDERWRMKENRDRVVKRVADELIKHISPHLKFSLREIVQKVAKFEERVYASVKTEDEYRRVVVATSKSILARSWKDAEAKNLLTSPSALALEALRAAFGEIEEMVQLNEEVVDELGLPTFVIPEGWKMPRNFVATALDTPSIFGSLFDGFNQRPKTAENQNLLAEIKDINNRLFDCEVVIAEKENVETAVGLAAKQSEGLLVKIMYNAVTINQNLVSKFTSDKKSLIKPLRLLIPSSYPSSSLVILDELPLKVSDDLRGLFERAKAKLKYKLQSMNVPWLIKDIARVWEHCAREAILEYAYANGGGTFTSMHGDWDVC